MGRFKTLQERELKIMKKKEKKKKQLDALKKIKEKIEHDIPKDMSRAREEN